MMVLRGSLRWSHPGFSQPSLSELIYIMVNLPYRCNYRCLKCCNVLENTPRASHSVRLGESSFRQLLRVASDGGVRVLVVAGEGEPLFDPDFRRVIELATENDLLPYVVTNGSRLDASTVDFLADHHASLIISLDSLNAERYNRLIQGSAALSDVLANIDNCRRVYARLSHDRNGDRVVSLAINMVVNQINCDEVESLRKFCGDDIVFVCNKPTRIGLAEQNWVALYGEAPSNTDIDSILARLWTGQQPLGTTSDGQWCAHMRNGVSISPRGEVLICAYALETEGLYDAPTLVDLASTNRYVMESVEQFYGIHGHGRCILRHPKYKEFISFLKARRKK